MAQVSFKQATRRYHSVFWPMMAIYVAACFGGAFLQRQFESNPLWLSAGLATLTVLPVLAVLWFIWRYVQETDEFNRQMHLEALTIGGLVTAGTAGIVGFLQLYEAIDSFPVFFILPFFFFSYGMARLFRRGACV